MYDSVVLNNSEFNLGIYLRMMNNTQIKKRTFLNSIVDGSLEKGEREIQEEREVKWTTTDKQNKNFAISTVGYDPFDLPSFTDEDRRYLFNSLAKYCDDPSVSTDNHKLISVITLVQSQLQCRKIDDFINLELLTKTPEEAKLKKLSDTKKQLLDAIAKIAQDNNIASNYNANSKQGADTASQKMKDIEKDGFELIKVNLFDIETAACMKQTMDLSNQSILDQIQLDENDYVGMLKEQYELIQEQKQKVDSLEEEKRLLQIRVQELEILKKKR